MSETTTEVVLWIGTFSSRCGACGKNADPYEPAHIMAMMEGNGCGAEFTHVGSSVFYPGMTDRTHEMRPDLALATPEPSPAGGGSE